MSLDISTLYTKSLHITIKKKEKTSQEKKHLKRRSKLGLRLILTRFRDLIPKTALLFMVRGCSIKKTALFFMVERICFVL